MPCIEIGRLEQAAVAHQPADRDIFAAVLRGIADPHHAAVGQPQPARALDLEEEEVDRIGRPGELEPAPGKRALLDRGAVVIGDVMALLVDPAAAALARSAGLASSRSGGRPVDRHVVAGLAGAAAADLGLVIAGGEGGAVADLDQLEMGCEEIDRGSAGSSPTVAVRRRLSRQSSARVRPLASWRGEQRAGS